MKTIELDKDLVAFALERCDADLKLGLLAVSRAQNIRTGKALVDYVVKVKRLREALLKA